MQRGVTLLLLTMATTGSTLAADMPPRHSGAGPLYGAPPPVERDPDVLFTPALPTIPPLVHTPILPGRATLPGYYGSTHSYDYRGPLLWRSRSSATGIVCPTPAACTATAKAVTGFAARATALSRGQGGYYAGTPNRSPARTRSPVVARTTPRPSDSVRYHRARPGFSAR